MRYFRYFLTIALVVAAAWIISSKFREVYYDIPLLLKEANKLMLVFLFIFQAINYLGDGWLCQMLLGIAGFRVDFKDTLKIAVLGVVGNHVAPFVGGTIVSYHSYKKIGVPSPAISFLVLTWTFLIWMIYLLFFVISLLILPKDILNITLLKIILLIFICLILILGIIFILFKKKYSFRLLNILNIIFKPAIKFVNFFRKNEVSVPKVFEKFTSDISLCFNFLSQNKKKLPKLLFLSSLYYAGDILTLYFAFRVFGFHPNLALLIFSYTISSVLTLATLMPGAPGVTEASMAMVFIKFGLPAHIVLFSTILYRIFAYWLPLPFGAFLYFSLKDKNNLNSKNESEKS